MSYNRYSYVFNNPLKYVDPSGEGAAYSSHNRGGSDDMAYSNNSSVYGINAYQMDVFGMPEDWGVHAGWWSGSSGGNFVHDLGHFRGVPLHKVVLNNMIKELSKGKNVSLKYVAALSGGSVKQWEYPNGAIATTRHHATGQTVNHTVVYDANGEIIYSNATGKGGREGLYVAPIKGGEATLYGISIGGALGGGLGFAAGFVQDGSGNWGLFLDVNVHVGYGADVGFFTTKVQPTGNHSVLINDMRGTSFSQTVGVSSPIGGYGMSIGGTIDSDIYGAGRLDVRNYGTSDIGTKGYKFGSAAFAFEKPSARLSIGGFATKTNTYIWDF